MIACFEDFHIEVWANGYQMSRRRYARRTRADNDYLHAGHSFALPKYTNALERFSAQTSRESGASDIILPENDKAIYGWRNHYRKTCGLMAAIFPVIGLVVDDQIRCKARSLLMS
jgi:hypothetical protein